MNVSDADRQYNAQRAAAEHSCYRCLSGGGWRCHTLEGRASEGAHLATGLFHGEYGSQGVAISSAVSAIASTNRPHMRVRGPGLLMQLRQAAADHCTCPVAADSHSAGAMALLRRWASDKVSAQQVHSG
jgi:hypothetical protein